MLGQARQQNPGSRRTTAMAHQGRRRREAPFAFDLREADHLHRDCTSSAPGPAWPSPAFPRACPCDRWRSSKSATMAPHAKASSKIASFCSLVRVRRREVRPAGSGTRGRPPPESALLDEVDHHALGCALAIPHRDTLANVRRDLAHERNGIGVVEEAHGLAGLTSLEGPKDGGVPEALRHTARVEEIDSLGMEMRVGFGRLGLGRAAGAQRPARAHPCSASAMVGISSNCWNGGGAARIETDRDRVVAWAPSVKPVRPSTGPSRRGRHGRRFSISATCSVELRRTMAWGLPSRVQGLNAARGRHLQGHGLRP